MNKPIVEEWKDINGYEGLYQVSNTGKVKSLVGWNGHKYIPRVRNLIARRRYQYRMGMI